MTPSRPMRNGVDQRDTRDADPGDAPFCCERCAETLAHNAAVMASGLRSSALSPAFAKSYHEHIANGDLEAARHLVNREMARAHSLLDSIAEFERSLDLD